MNKIFSILIVFSLLIGVLVNFTSCDIPLVDDHIGGEVPGNDQGNIDKEDGDDSGKGDGDDQGKENPSCSDGIHVDNNNDDSCDICFTNVLVIIDFYAVNDLHGKFCDTDTQPGVDELGSYLNNRKEIDDNVVILSSGDMWQGSAESNLTNGVIITEWMNAMGFVSMTIGNHEYDWGEEMIIKNAEVAEFPFLAINIYDVKTGQRVDYCEPSVIIEREGVKIGIIGAIGDCYSSIAADMTSGVEFKIGTALNTLVKNEANRLRQNGADIIVYSVHYGSSNLPSGVADIIFEGHSHQTYVQTDGYGITHLQGGGDNEGISHAEVGLNIANKQVKVREANFIGVEEYIHLEDDPATEAIEENYRELIEMATEVVGVTSKNLSSNALADLVSELYLKVGLERWGDKYDIVLGGGFIKPRSPYSIPAGEVTYGDILPIFPFDNQITLCSVSGANLISKFLETTNTAYHVTCSEYGESIRKNIDPNKTYYIVVDSYTSDYVYNGLTVVDYYDDGVYCRDLIAEEIRSGRFYISHDNYELTSIKEALSIGKNLSVGEQTQECYYIKGTITSVKEQNYGNLYIKDGNGNSIYVYGLCTLSGVLYGNMDNPPKVGDTIVIYGPILNFRGTIEISSATLIATE